MGSLERDGRGHKEDHAIFLPESSCGFSSVRDKGARERRPNQHAQCFVLVVSLKYYISKKTKIFNLEGMGDFIQNKVLCTIF